MTHYIFSTFLSHFGKTPVDYRCFIDVFDINLEKFVEKKESAKLDFLELSTFCKLTHHKTVAVIFYLSLTFSMLPLLFNF